MKSWLEHPWRVTIRLLWLGLELLITALRYVVHCGFRSRSSLPAARALWLQKSSQRLQRIFKMRPQVAGTIPKTGLLVCNHLSYLDILVLAALSPCVFVAKNEVSRWPVFGWFARLAGTIFVNRDKRSEAAASADRIERALQTGALVVLFPEGTSSGGDTVLPFKSSLLEPATRQTRPLFAGLIHYELGDGDVREEVCYWKDMTLVPHLINLLTKRAIQASVKFAEIRDRSSDRKELARQLHAEVLRLKESRTMPRAEKQVQYPTLLQETI